jgi:hypothetical protein
MTENFSFSERERSLSVGSDEKFLLKSELKGEDRISINLVIEETSEDEKFDVFSLNSYENEFEHYYFSDKVFEKDQTLEKEKEEEEENQETETPFQKYFINHFLKAEKNNQNIEKEKKILIDFLSLDFDFVDSEPIFLSAFLYDKNRNKRISEEKHFDLINGEVKKVFFKNETEENTPKFIFSVNEYDPNIHLIIKMRKTYNSMDYKGIKNTYLTNNKNRKALTKKMIETYLYFEGMEQKIGIISYPLFQKTNNNEVELKEGLITIDEDIYIKNFSKEMDLANLKEKQKLNGSLLVLVKKFNTELFESNKEYRNLTFSSLKKGAYLHINRYKQYFENYSSKNEIDPKIYKKFEVETINSEKRNEYFEFKNFIFIYPQKIKQNMKNVKNSKFHNSNILIEVSVNDTLEKENPIIFRTEVYLTTDIMDETEIKIDVPFIFKKSHFIKFNFYNINYDINLDVRKNLFDKNNLKIKTGNINN